MVSSLKTRSSPRFLCCDEKYASIKKLAALCYKKREYNLRSFSPFVSFYNINFSTIYPVPLVGLDKITSQPCRFLLGNSSDGKVVSRNSSRRSTAGSLRFFSFVETAMATLAATRAGKSSVALSLQPATGHRVERADRPLVEIVRGEARLVGPVPIVFQLRPSLDRRPRLWTRHEGPRGGPADGFRPPPSPHCPPDGG